MIDIDKNTHYNVLKFYLKKCSDKEEYIIFRCPERRRLV